MTETNTDTPAEDYKRAIAELIAESEQSLDVAERMADECAEKYGVRYPVPTVVPDPDDEFVTGKDGHLGLPET